MSKTVTRLYTQFQPDHYDLLLHPDKVAMTFSGRVTIRGKKVGRPSQRLTFHQKDLKCTSATVVKHDKNGDTDVKVERVNTQNSLNEVRVHADTMLYPGEYSVTIEFTAPLTRGMTGIYPCFFNVDGKEQALVATQFESHHAREAFPCIDEPEAKATFDLSVVAPKDEVVLANTPAKSTTAYASQDGGHTAGQTKAGSAAPLYQVTTFETTPRMSSYLLAFVVGNIHGKHTKTERGTTVSLWATAAQPSDALDFGLDVAKRAIEFFEGYFGIDYPLPKADHVALPDFSAGAMENWGLITYRERVLLAYPEDSSQSTREMIALVIAHETSHQWFGNLVTMRWWNDLWLNESFANMMEYQCVDALFPEWHVWDTFTAEEGLAALRRDATPGVQSVRIDVHHPDEISSIFDPSIVYAKGGRLLHMLKSYIGDEAFRKGLTLYFKKHAYGNTEGSDLWAALSEVSGKDIGSFMNPWLERPGFPVITPRQSGKDLLINQAHFSDNPAKADPERLWPVPLFGDSVHIPELLKKKEVSVKLLDDSIALLNQNASGHYLVNYAQPEQIEHLAQVISTHHLPPAARLMALNDSSMLARAGYQNYGAVLTLLGSYKDESSEPVWDIISVIMGELRRFIYHDHALEEPLKAYIRTLIKPQYERLGWNEIKGESAADQKLRAIILGMGAYAEEPSIVKTALDKFAAAKIKPNSIPTELRGIIYTVAVRTATPDAVEFLLQLHDKTSNSELQNDIASAMGATRDASVAKHLLERIKNPEVVKPQDADRWLAYLLRNQYVGDVAWNWMEANWDWIEHTYGSDKNYDYMPRYASSACNTKASAERYSRFFKPKESQIALKRNIVIGIEEIANRIAWLERDLPSIQDFFSKLSQ